jgi:hypothetical protein
VLHATAQQDAIFPDRMTPKKERGLQEFLSENCRAGAQGEEKKLSPRAFSAK